VGQTQVDALQTMPPLQPMPHLPQLFWSLESVTQVRFAPLPQATSPLGHTQLPF
jgi:hypothetical protein